MEMEGTGDGGTVASILVEGNWKERGQGKRETNVEEEISGVRSKRGAAAGRRGEIVRPAPG
jgi:hypothetical protein